MRDFTKVTYERNNPEVRIPHRKTDFSAGYDFYSPDTTILEPHIPLTIFTGIKCYMEDTEHLQLSIRSGLASKGVILAQGIGIIDADYADCIENEGNIGFTLINLTSSPISITAGDRIGQGIFHDYKVIDQDEAYEKESRKGGFGSTGN